MGLLKRIVGILGFLKGDNHDHSDDDARRHADGESSSDRADKEEAQCRRTGKGFSVQVPIALDRAAAAAAAAHGPVLVQCNLGDGGVQGLQWYAKRLKIDEDGDVADEFLDEVLPEALRVEDQRQVTKFAIKCSTRPVKVRNQIMAASGNIQQSVEYQGRLQWI